MIFEEVNILEMTLTEITDRRKEEHCYLIEDIEGKYIVIYGSRFTEITNDDFKNIISTFLSPDSSLSWDFVRKRLKHDRDDALKDGQKSKWLYLDNEAKEKSIEVSTIYVDGIKKI